MKTKIKYISLKKLSKYITYIFYKFNYGYYHQIIQLIVYKIIDLLLKKKNQNTL